MNLGVYAGIDNVIPNSSEPSDHISIKAIFNIPKNSYKPETLIGYINENKFIKYYTCG